MNCDFVSISVDSQFSTLGWTVSNKFDSVACGCPILCSVKIGLPFFVQTIRLETGYGGIFSVSRTGT